MIFKKWPYWVKGGIIVSVIYLIILLILKIIPCDSSGYLGGSCLGLSILLLVLLSPASGVLNLIGLENNNLYLVGLLAFIAYFIIGAFIGSIIKIIKQIKA